jgi:glycerate-2-kinase
MTIIKNPRETAEQIFRAALAAADPYRAVKGQSENILTAYREGGFKRIVAIGFGKASPLMASALEDTMGELIEAGIIITKYGHLGERRLKKIQAFEAAHPVPDKNGLNATSEILEVLQSTDEDTLVVCLISGGGSALLEAPLEGITLAGVQEVTDALLHAGADIGELNAVRKHISGVKGGRLAQVAYPARVISLIVSDVIGDPLDVIASGPTAPDASTWQDAMDVMQKYNIRAPEAVVKTIKDGVAGKLPGCPKPGDVIFRKVENLIVGSNRLALDAAKAEAEATGFLTEILTGELSGEAREAAGWLASEALQRTERPLCLIAGGETTVTVRGAGKGGRNTELALAFAMEIEGSTGVTLLAAGTDGTDGPTDAAGAVVDGATTQRAKEAGIEPAGYLQNNDSYTFFDLAGGLLKTGPTGTNVMDIDIVVLT